MQMIDNGNWKGLFDIAIEYKGNTRGMELRFGYVTANDFII